MTDQLQRRTYEDQNEIESDPFGLLDRDNRNHAKKRRLIEARTAADPGDRLLEVGCGDGLHARAYADAYRYVGVDVSASLATRTAARIGRRGDAQVQDATALAFADDAFDAVVGTAVLHHMADPLAALQEWCRVVRPGGSVTLAEPNYLFPKDLVTAHTVPEERHKTNMAPWRVRRLCRAVPGRATVEPRIYTPPWPRRAARAYDRLDAVARRLPGLRWCSQMILIHVELPC